MAKENENIVRGFLSLEPIALLSPSKHTEIYPLFSAKEETMLYWFNQQGRLVEQERDAARKRLKIVTSLGEKGEVYRTKKRNHFVVEGTGANVSVWGDIHAELRGEIDTLNVQHGATATVLGDLNMYRVEPDSSIFFHASYIGRLR